ncbi:MAG: DUF2807 domain-containing protein [candidate division Zixibacteria bacterium]|nr:DUF2807 domain-containing protein [candidate division Zixibacteria bacterium]
MGQNRYKIILATLLLVTMGTVSAEADGLFNFGRGERGSGDVITEQRSVTSFERIHLECSADLLITVGSELSVSVTTDDNLQDNIITEVVSLRTLLIDSKDSFRTRRGVLVEITVPELTLIEVDGSGDVEITGLNNRTFEVELDGSGNIELGGKINELNIELQGSGQIVVNHLTSEMVNIRSQGSGDIEIRGQTEQLEISMRGSGDIDARRLKATDVFIRIHGSGDAEVYAETDFDGAVYGSGDIDVYGNPDNFDRHVSGSGDINRH